MAMNINWRFQKQEPIKVRQYNYNQNLSQLGQGLGQIGAAVQTGRNRNLDEELAKMMEEEAGIMSDDELGQQKNATLNQLDQEEQQLLTQLKQLQNELSTLKNEAYETPMEGADGVI